MEDKEENLKALIVTGCLAERYRDMVSNEIPEVDVVVGIGRNGDIVKNLPLLGGKAVLFAIMTALCSTIVVYIFSRLFLEKEGEK